MTAVALAAGFLLVCVLTVAVIGVTNSRRWHDRLHVARGYRVVVGCDHCDRERQEP